MAEYEYQLKFVIAAPEDMTEIATDARRDCGPIAAGDL